MTPNKILSLLKVQWISALPAGKDISRILQDSLGYVDRDYKYAKFGVFYAKNSSMTPKNSIGESL